MLAYYPASDLFSSVVGHQLPVSACAADIDLGIELTASAFLLGQGLQESETHRERALPVVRLAASISAAGFVAILIDWGCRRHRWDRGRG